MMDKGEILDWLREERPDRLEALWKRADGIRAAHVGSAVHLRGLIEFSSYCVRHCGYCGLRADNRSVARYRMSEEEILASALEAQSYGYGTVVLQSGEDFGVSAEWMGRVIRRIKSETPLAVTLSLGERSEEELRYWKECGADRYLLRFETSNRRLFAHIHPPRAGQAVCDRIALLRAIKGMGYEAGSGVLIGVPGQTYDDLANDLLLFADLDLDMVGVGPYIPHPNTPLAKEQCGAPKTAEQVPNTEEMTYKTVALTRLVRPWANIPSTTALATLNTASGRELGLSRGANVIMPNVTPVQYRALYEIYPAKACLAETARTCHTCIGARIRALGREIGVGRGDSLNYVPASAEAARVAAGE